MLFFVCCFFFLFGVVCCLLLCYDGDGSVDDIDDVDVNDVVVDNDTDIWWLHVISK